MSADVKAVLSAELAVLRTAFGDSDPRTALVNSALLSGDPGVMAAVAAHRAAALDEAKALAAVRERLIKDAGALPVRRYAVLDAAPLREASSPVMADRVGCSARSVFSLEQVPFARLLINPSAGDTGLLRPALSRMQTAIGDALATFEADGRVDKLRAVG